VRKLLELQVDNRAKVRLLVSILPGVHLRELQRLLGVSFNSTRYHVDKLTKTGEIIRVEDGGYSRLYPVGISEPERALFPIVRGETDRKVLVALASNESLSNKQLSDLTNLAKSTISEHLAELVRLGVVRTRQIRESGISYELEKPEQIRSLLRNQNLSLLRKASDRFIDLWAF
jgi:predicted transcriptional regulator